MARGRMRGCWSGRIGSLRVRRAHCAQRHLKLRLPKDADLKSFQLKFSPKSFDSVTCPEDPWGALPLGFHIP